MFLMLLWPSQGATQLSVYAGKSMMLAYGLCLDYAKRYMHLCQLHATGMHMAHAAERVCADKAHAQAALQLSETSCENSCCRTECNKQLWQYPTHQHTLAKSGTCSAGGVQHSGKGRGDKGAGELLTLLKLRLDPLHLQCGQRPCVHWSLQTMCLLRCLRSQHRIKHKTANTELPAGFQVAYPHSSARRGFRQTIV